MICPDLCLIVLNLSNIRLINSKLSGITENIFKCRPLMCQGVYKLHYAYDFFDTQIYPLKANKWWRTFRNYRDPFRNYWISTFIKKWI